MFFPEPLKRIRILAHQSVKEKVVKELHALGAVHITDFREKLTEDEWKGLLDAHPVSPDARKITTRVMSITRLLDIFSMVAPEEEESFFKRLFAPSPPEKIPVEDISGEKLLEVVESIVSDVESCVFPPLESMEKKAAEKAGLVLQRESFDKIKAFDIPLEYIGEGSFVNTLLGIASKNDFNPLKKEIEKATSGLFCFSESPISESETCILVICLVSDFDDVSACFRKWNVERVFAGGFKKTPSEAILEIDGKIDVYSKEQKKCRESISLCAQEWRARLKALKELLIIERERAEAHSSFAMTGSVTAIEGWITQKKSSEIACQIETCCDSLAVVKITAPDEPVDNIPVALNNPGILKHFEPLVKLYATPRYDEIDPTIFIVPSFLFFFGIMITDAMYGLMTLLLGFFILRGGGKYSALLKSSGMLLLMGGASTVVLGAVTGGWFGNLAIEYLGMTFLKSLIIINPMVDVSKCLIIAIGIGLLHLNIGMVLGIIKDVRRNNTSGALKYAWIFFLEISLIFYYFGIKTYALVFAVPALLFLLYSEKGMALFGVTGLLGDTLSYTRLMALGLVSFGLAVAINALAMMVTGISYVGWLTAILILAGGHIFSFVLNLMGAFAHGIRLHFVEFFGKFYSGGGYEFEPFSIKRKITEVK